MFKRKIRGILKEIVSELYPEVEAINFEVEKPKREEWGDLSTNISLVLQRILKDNPRKIAETIKKALEERVDIFARVEVAGAGFINFWIKDSFLYEQLRKALLEGKHYGRINIGEGRKVLIEFVSANPTGPLHIGHGRGAAYGDALARILTFTGFDVTKEYYINDRGTQMDILGASVYLRAKELKGKSINFPEDYYQGDYIYDIAQEALKHYEDLLEREEASAIALCRDLAMKSILEDIKKDLKDFGVTFDSWYSEQSLYNAGLVQEVIQILREKGYIYEENGALWFRSSLFGDEKDRVVRKSSGEWTYFASDIAYHYEKFIKRGYDLAINLWGADHHGYVPRLKGALKALDIDPEKVVVLLIQMVNLIEGGQIKSMSTRKAEYVELKELIREVGVDAARFIFLSRSEDSPLDFDVELAKRQSAENPVYYVQYAHARICSVKEKAQEFGYDLNLLSKADLSLLKEKEELNLLKKIAEFSDNVEFAVMKLAPYKLTYYLLDLASSFHEYYNRFRIIGETQELTLARLALVEGCRIVLHNGLFLLGVSSPNKM